MATTVSLTGSLTGMAGIPFSAINAQAVRGYAQASERMVIDLDDNKTRLGRVPLVIATNGDFALTGVPATGDDRWMPELAGWRLVFEWNDQTSGPGKVTTPWFQLPATAQFKDVVFINPTAIDPQFLLDLDASLAAAADSATDAEGFRDETQALREGIVGDLSTTDSQVATLATPGSGSLLEGVLSDTIAQLGGDSTVRDFVAKAEAGVSDVTMLVVSDSTAAAAGSWVEQLAPLLAARFPHLSVKRATWTDGSPGSYPALTTVATGSGAYSLNIYNASKSGETWQYHFDVTRWPVMLAALTPDLTFVSLGHNDDLAGMVSGGSATKQRAKAVTHLEFLRGMHSSARMVLMSQNPNLNSATSSESRANMLRSLAQSRGFGFIDVCQAFHDDGRTLAGTLISGDNTHPTADGYALWADRVYAEFFPDSTGRVQAQEPPAFSTAGLNFVKDPTFAQYVGTSLPVNVTLTNCTHTVDTTNFETEGKSLKLTKTATGQAYADVILPIDRVKGRTVITTARIRVPTGANTTTVGQVSLRDSVTIDGSATWGQVDQWIWRTMIRKIPATATFATVRIYVDTNAASATLENISIDRVGVWIGDVPHDPAPSELGPIQFADVGFLYVPSGTTPGDALVARMEALGKVTVLDAPILYYSGAGTAGTVGVAESGQSPVSEPSGWARDGNGLLVWTGSVDTPVWWDLTSLPSTFTAEVDIDQITGTYPFGFGFGSPTTYTKVYRNNAGGWTGVNQAGTTVISATVSAFAAGKRLSAVVNMTAKTVDITLNGVTTNLTATAGMVGSATHFGLFASGGSNQPLKVSDLVVKS